MVWRAAQGRAAARQNESDAPVVPITVRQLEAVVRIEESFARMQLQPVATEAHVRRALDLFTVSTMDAVKSGVMEAVVRTVSHLSALLVRVDLLLGRALNKAIGCV